MAASSCVPSMFDSLEVKVLFTSGWRRSDSEAQGRRRETVSERSVKQRREPMNKNRMTRPTALGERARSREAHFHQGCWW
jgi:hypothetical protein